MSSKLSFTFVLQCMIIRVLHAWQNLSKIKISSATRERKAFLRQRWWQQTGSSWTYGQCPSLQILQILKPLWGQYLIPNMKIDPHINARRSRTKDQKPDRWFVKTEITMRIKNSKQITLVVHRNNKILSCVPLTSSPLSWVFCLEALYSIKSISTCGPMEKQLQAWAFLTQTVRQCSPCCLCVTLGPPSPPKDTGHPSTTPKLRQTRQEWDSGEIKRQTSPKAFFFFFFEVCCVLKGCKRTSNVACAVWLSTTENPNVRQIWKFSFGSP